MNTDMWSSCCNLCGGLRAYLPRTNWRDSGAEPANMVPHRLELCRARSLGVLLCPVCDFPPDHFRPGEGGPPRRAQAVQLT